ncbi:hypothetical protein SANT12839_098680 [Streptomyces antimycoticus]|uniref:Uncharacterized protein n=1 Tax=Streptomyces antimycoticus TaxID=68175 RepID=A0A4D4KQ07_9ACTN|nr:hypothetical protein SANT12839_098680 [Streptomyces antimycoticus]
MNGATRYGAVLARADVAAEVGDDLSGPETGSGCDGMARTHAVAGVGGQPDPRPQFVFHIPPLPHPRGGAEGVHPARAGIRTGAGEISPVRTGRGLARVAVPVHTVPPGAVVGLAPWAALGDGSAAARCRVR